jgi:hypothetical protein
MAEVDRDQELRNKVGEKVTSTQLKKRRRFSLLLALILSFATLALGIYANEGWIIALALLNMLYCSFIISILIMSRGHGVSYNKQSNRK